jgi:hypothetical protein
MYRRSLELAASQTQVNIAITKWRLAQQYNKMYQFPHAKLNSVQTVRYGIYYMRSIYRMSQEERSIFWEVIVSVILSKKLYMNMCPIPKGFRDRAI